MAQIVIPTPLKKFTQNQSRIEVSGNTVKEAILHLTEKYPGLKGHLFDQNGEIRSFVRIFVGDDDIHGLDNEDTIVRNQSIISIVPAIAGG
jgi:molybdopterin converting factor small subunit